MFALHVSYNLGISYYKEREAKTLEELRPRMIELDNDLLRWYLTKDGEDYFEEACAIHAGLIQFVQEIQKSNL
jgi:hypothetical protein